MVKGHSLTLMVINIKVIGKKIKETVAEQLIMYMVTDMKASGKMVTFMEKEHSIL